MDNDLKYMKEAYRQAQKALAIDEVPVGVYYQVNGQPYTGNQQQRT